MQIRSDSPVTGFRAFRAFSLMTIFLGWALVATGCMDESGSGSTGSDDDPKVEGSKSTKKGPFPKDWLDAAKGDIPADKIPEDLENWMEEIDLLFFDLEEDLINKKHEPALKKLTSVVWMLRATRDCVDKEGYAVENDGAVQKLIEIRDPTKAGQFDAAREAYVQAQTRCDGCHDKYRDD